MTWMIIIMFNMLLFILFKHPLSNGLILLLQTILISTMMGMLTLNYWYSYMLFLIMIGGMLILFIYMTSIASNEKFKMNWNIIVMLIILLLMISLMIWSNNFMFMKIMKNLEMFSYLYNMKSFISLNKFLNYPNNLILMSMIMYLLITLIAIVKMTNFKYGPLRQKF